MSGEMSNNTVLPKPEVRGTGTVTYRCWECKEPVDRPVWVGVAWESDFQPMVLTPDIRTYHREHVPSKET